MEDDEYDEDRPKPTVSPAAARIIEALREKPEVLAEVAMHFRHGWPTVNLVDGWMLERTARLPYLSRESFTDGKDHCYVHIRPFVGEGHDGSQWEAMVTSKQDSHRRVFDDIPAAAEWVAIELRCRGFIFNPAPPTSDLINQLIAILNPEVGPDAEVGPDPLDDDMPF